MFDWWLLFAGGLLGSTHCVGMCGGLALTLGLAASRWQQNLARQVIYTLGRAGIYALGGALIAGLGSRVVRMSAAWTHLSAWLAVLAGVVLIIQALKSTGLVSWRIPAGKAPCLTAGLFRGVLLGPSLAHAFAAGILTGFLPCGLLYGYLALAASTGQMATGAAMMGVFAIGTAPLMILAGLGSSLATVSVRRRLVLLAAVCVLVTGVLSIGRGVQALISQQPVSCPYCQR